jgi:hypothetical protein
VNPYRVSSRLLESIPMDSTRKWSKHYLLLILLAILLIGLTFSFGGMLGEEAAQRRLRPLLRTGPQACTDELHSVSPGTSGRCGNPDQSGFVEAHAGKVFLHCRCGRSAVFSCGPMDQVGGSSSTSSPASCM